MDAGLIVYLAGDGEVSGVLVAPPLIASPTHISEIIGKLDDALTRVESDDPVHATGAERGVLCERTSS